MGYDENVKKTLIAVLIPAVALTLSACGGEDGSTAEAVAYPTMIEWYEAIDSDDSPVHCVNREAKSPPLIDEAKYQVFCTDQNGAEANLMIFDSQDKMEDRLYQARQRQEWETGNWIILRGPNWTVDCKSEGQCELWQRGFGGEILKTG